MQKNLLLTIASLFIVLFSYAQVTKGSILLGGGFSLSKGKTSNIANEGESTSFFVNPNFGFVVKDNSVIGIGLSYGHNSQKPNTDNHKDNTYGGGVYYRKYHQLGKSFYLFGEGQTYYSYRKQESNDQISKHTTKYTNIGINVYPGIAYSVSKRLHLEVGINNLFNINYSHNRDETISSNGSYDSKSNYVSTSSDFSPATALRIGFRFILG
jgi:hypothetical protein